VYKFGGEPIRDDGNGGGNGSGHNENQKPSQNKQPKWMGNRK